MRRPILVLLIALTVSLVGYFLCYELATRPAKTLLAAPDCGQAWLCREFHLTGAQEAKIAKMHDDYRPTCERMCQRIAEANGKLDGLIAESHTVTPEIEAALKEWALLQNDCRQAMLQHVYAVSAEMSVEDGKRYVKMATARIVTPGMAHASLLAH